MYENTPTANALRKVLPLLKPEQTAELRNRFGNEPDRLLEEARRLHELTEGGATGTPADRPVKDRIADAFGKMQTTPERQARLRKQYDGREQELLDKLTRDWQRRQRGETEQL